MQKFIFTNRCGCCEEILSFKDEASAERAFNAAVAAGSGWITDDAGEEFPLDLDYGYRAAK